MEDLDQKFIELNRMRKRVLSILVIFYIMIIFFGIYGLVAILSVDIDSDIINGYVGIIVIFAACVHRLIIKGYRKKFKSDIVPIAISRFGENIEYSPEGLPRSDAEKTDMFGHFTKFSSEDTVKGKIKDVNFRCSDVKLGYFRGSGKHRRYVKVCHGQLYIFDFNKRFKTNTIIREKLIQKPNGLVKMELENVDFNNQFHIYTNNEHDAFYILTPHFMEKLMTLEKRHPGNLYIAFYHSMLFIGIDNNKDRFEPPLLSDITPSTITSQIDDLNTIKDIIDELRLNNKIFLYDEVSL